jgi:MYXO-CTERM domain-containing protein
MDDESGCNCSQSSGAGGAFMVILGLFGFAATRRRD